MNNHTARKAMAVVAILASSSMILNNGAFAASAPSTQDRQASKKIERAYEKQTDRAGGDWSSYVTLANPDGTHRPVVEEGADTPVEAYSVNKLAVAIAVLDKVDKGQLALGQKLDLEPRFIAEGSGLYHLQPVYGDSLTLANLITTMLLVSDNTAVRMLSSVAPGTEINQILAEKGFVHTRVEPLPDDPKRFFLGQTTPREMHKLLEGVADKTLLSAESSDFILNVMRWSSAGYNDGVRNDMGSDERARIATKYGAFEDHRNEVGIMFDELGKVALIYSFFSSGVDDGDNYGATNPAVEAHAKLGLTMIDAIS